MKNAQAVLIGYKNPSEKIVFEDKHKKDINELSFDITGPLKHDIAAKNDLSKKENLTYEKKHKENNIVKINEKTSQPKQYTAIIGELNKLEERKRELNRKAKKLEEENEKLKVEVEKERLKKEDESVLDKIESILPEKLKTLDKSENISDEKKAEMVKSSPELLKTHEQKKAEEMRVEKLRLENEKLQTEIQNEKLKKENKSAKEIIEIQQKEKPTNDEKVKLVGGVGGLINTAIEQLTGTGDFAPSK